MAWYKHKEIEELLAKDARKLLEIFCEFDRFRRNARSESDLERGVHSNLYPFNKESFPYRFGKYISERGSRFLEIAGLLPGIITFWLNEYNEIKIDVARKLKKREARIIDIQNFPKFYYQEGMLYLDGINRINLATGETSVVKEPPSEVWVLYVTRERNRNADDKLKKLGWYVDQDTDQAERLRKLKN